MSADAGKRVLVALWGGPSDYNFSIIRQPRRFDQLLRRELRRMTPYTVSER